MNPRHLFLDFLLSLGHMGPFKSSLSIISELEMVQQKVFLPHVRMAKYNMPMSFVLKGNALISPDFTLTERYRLRPNT